MVLKSGHRPIRTKNFIQLRSPPPPSGRPLGPSHRNQVDLREGRGKRRSKSGESKNCTVLFSKGKNEELSTNRLDPEGVIDIRINRI
jgi:hypothetical protein